MHKQQDSDLDYEGLTVVSALPVSAYYPSGAEDVFARLRGARIVQIGGAAEHGVDGGGLIIDYISDGDKRRVVFAFNELGMWVEYEGPIHAPTSV